MTGDWVFVMNPLPQPDDLSTWEGRMSARAHAREDAERNMRRELEAAARKAEREAHDRSDCADRRFFEGTCDVCGQPLRFDHCFTHDGIIDYGIDAVPGEESLSLMYTWIRHIDGPLPGCDTYSSTVYEVS